MALQWGIDQPSRGDEKGRKLSSGNGGGVWVYGCRAAKRLPGEPPHGESGRVVAPTLPPLEAGDPRVAVGAELLLSRTIRHRSRQVAQARCLMASIR